MAWSVRLKQQVRTLIRGFSIAKRRAYLERFSLVTKTRPQFSALTVENASRISPSSLQFSKCMVSTRLPKFSCR